MKIFRVFRLFKNLTFPVLDNMSNTTAMTQSGIRFSFDYKITAEQLKAQTTQLIEKTRNAYDNLAAVKVEDVSYDNLMQVIGNIENDLFTEKFYLEFPQKVALIKSIRDASVEASKWLSKFIIETRMREDIFVRLVALDKKQHDLDADSKRFLDRLICEGKRNGLYLPLEVREQIKALKNQIENLCIDFKNNVTEDKTSLEFTEDELDGLPKDFISNLQKSPDTQKLKVTMKYPHSLPILERARNPDTRKRLELAFNSMCATENIPILKEVVILRHKLANLLGFPTQAAFRCDICMAKSEANVTKFLSDLAEKLTPLWIEDKKELLELKEKDCKELGIPFDGHLNPYDMRYLMTKMKEIKYSYEEETLRTYFPLSHVTKTILEIYQNMLGFAFTEIEEPVVWHPDVKMFSVEDSKSGEHMGYFYLDLHPREGKFSHAAIDFMQPSCILQDGSKQIPLVPILCNFTKATATKPSLLTHDEVETFFHEFGHVMHYICSQDSYASMQVFLDFGIETDFFEAPSQMLENWCWEPTMLKMMSSHYETKEPIPDNLMESLIKSRLANVAYMNLRQIILATFDQKIHTMPDADPKEIYDALSEEIVGIKPSEGTNFAATFYHLFDVYDARYYSYLWSEVFSMDMFYTRFKGNLLDTVVGKDYRDKIISQGARKDAIELLRDFLGRDPNQDAFLLSKGLKI